MQQSIFDRYGGAETVSDLVFDFYDRVIQSERLASFFDACDMRRLIEHQVRYISAVMGGPPSFSEEHLRDVHAPLAISQAAFDEMLDHMRAAMQTAEFAPEDIDRVIRRLAGLRRLIVTH